MNKVLAFLLLFASICQAQNSFRSHRYKLLTLNDGISFWRMEEASGATRIDELGSSDLADSNTVAQATGLIGNAADFEKDNNEFIWRADNADLSTGDIDYTIALWAKLESKPGADIVMMSKDTTGQQEYVLFWDSSDDYQFVIRDNLTSSTAALAVSSYAPTLGVFDFIIAGQDTTSNVGFIQVNNGTIATDTIVGAAADGTADMQIGTCSGSTQFWDGVIDAVFFTKRLLTDFEKKMLYNNRHGMEYYSALGSWDRRN